MNIVVSEERSLQFGMVTVQLVDDSGREKKLGFTHVIAMLQDYGHEIHDES